MFYTITFLINLWRVLPCIKFYRWKMSVINKQEWCNFAQFVEHGNRCLDWIRGAAHLSYSGLVWNVVSLLSQRIAFNYWIRHELFSTSPWWIELEYQSTRKTEFSSRYVRFKYNTSLFIHCGLERVGNVLTFVWRNKFNILILLLSE
jgi:hypothetical protein